MRYSNYIGALSAAVLVAFCFAPLVYIESIHTTVTGLNSGPTNFGSPGLMHIFLSAFSIILFLVNRVWAKRSNVFVTAFNFAWSIRNFLLLSQCQMGECPEKRFGLFAIVVLSIVMLLMALFPHMKVQD